MANRVEASDSGTVSTDWTICALCQIKDQQPLVCPARSKRDPNAGFKAFSENIQEFHDLQSLSFETNLRRLNEGPDIEQTFIKNKAQWHKSCYLKLNNTQLERVRNHKRKAVEQP